MKLAKGMKIISEGWILKPKGFRVRFQQLVDGELVNVTVVDEKDTMVNYYVTGKPEIFNPKNKDGI